MTRGWSGPGYLWMTSDPATAERQRELVARQREWGVDGVELLGASELRERFPWVGESVLQARFRAVRRVDRPARHRAWPAGPAAGRAGR